MWIRSVPNSTASQDADATDNAAERPRLLPYRPCHHLVRGRSKVAGTEPDNIVIRKHRYGQPLGNEWGYTVCSRRRNQRGFLADGFPEPRRRYWDCKGVYRSRANLPKVAASPSPTRFGRRTEPRTPGAMERREAELITTIPTGSPFALPPTPRRRAARKPELRPGRGGQLDPAFPRVSMAGTDDIKNISRG